MALGGVTWEEVPENEWKDCIDCDGYVKTKPDNGMPMGVRCVSCTLKEMERGAFS